MKKGFSLLAAIFFLLIIATLSALGLSLSAKAQKQAGSIYLYEQAELLAKGATEYALVRLFKELPCGLPGGTACVGNTTSNCATFPTTLTGNFPNNTTPLLKYTVQIHYFDTASSTLNCPAIHTTQISTPNSRGTVRLDVTVESADSIKEQNPIRFHKRTLQKL